MKLFLLPLLIAGLLSGGCGLIPKRVELGQDKVRKFPEASQKRKEAERQAVKLAGEKAREAEKLAEGSAAEIPAGEAAELSEAVGRSLGPPSRPWAGEVAALVQKVDALTAAHNKLLDEFKRQNDENVGKKIEGTGWLSVPYFIWVGGALLLVFFVVAAAKIALSILATMNPAVSVGLGVAKMGTRALSTAFSQVLAGGERFKEGLKSINLTAEQHAAVRQLFRVEQERAQSPEVQEVIQELTK